MHDSSQVTHSSPSPFKGSILGGCFPTQRLSNRCSQNKVFLKNLRDLNQRRKTMSVFLPFKITGKGRNKNESATKLMDCHEHLGNRHHRCSCKMRSPKPTELNFQNLTAPVAYTLRLIRHNNDKTQHFTTYKYDLINDKIFRPLYFCTFAVSEKV